MENEIEEKQPQVSLSLRLGEDDKQTILEFLEGAGSTRGEGAARLAEIIRKVNFEEKHVGQAELLKSIDELSDRMRKIAEGLIESGELKIEAARADAQEQIEKAQLAVEKARDEVKDAEATRELLVQERELTAMNREQIADLEARLAAGAARIAELEAERESVKAREAEAEAAIAAKAEAEKAQLAAEKVAEEAKAALAAVRAEADKAAMQAAADLKAATDKAEAQKRLAASEVAHANDRAANAEGRAVALGDELARVRSERDASRADLAAAKAKADGLEQQVAMLRDLLAPKSEGAKDQAEAEAK